jgi:hypothetical protein
MISYKTDQPPRSSTKQFVCRRLKREFVIAISFILSRLGRMEYINRIWIVFMIYEFAVTSIIKYS